MLVRMYAPQGMHRPPVVVKKGPSALGVILIVGASLLFGGVGTVVLLIVLWPKGDKVGEVKILPAGPSVSTEANAGDQLAFRLDYVVNGGLGGSNRTRRKTVMNTYLAATKLTVTARHTSGAVETSTCDIDGHSTMTTSSPTQEDRVGVGVDCAITLSRAGKHEVSGVIAWDSNLAPVSATLEVRRVAAKR